ncbi:MAG: hypothetical protein J6R86_03570, partial [Lentisphaeria bacterium]|nr:hypothetical protein [Lentisphaeria bacterium]
EIEESERQRATGDEYGGDMPLPEDESPAVKAARKRFIAAQAKAQKVRLEQWVTENMPQIYQWTTEFLGSNPVIKPSERFKGEHFSGSFISKAFRTYSEYTPGKKQGKALEDYRTRRENALAFADGYSSDELAKAIVNKYGGNELDVEQQIIDYFRDLKRIDIKQMYREAMRENREYEADLNKEADAESAAIRFKELLDYAEQDKINIIRFQQKAALYARRYLPENQRGRFIGEIVKLANFDAAPSVKYPEGRRKYELEKLMRSMQNFRVVDRIDQILADLSQKVNKTGQTIGNLGDKGELFQKIKAIRAMSTLDVENRILDLREKVASITENEDGADEADAIREELALYETFGKLEQKTPDQAVEALRMLKDLRDNNKSSLLYRLQQQRQEIGKARLQAVVEIAGRKATGNAQAAKQPWKFALEQMGLRSLLDLVTSRAVTDFDQTVFGKLFTKIENSTQHGASLQREDNDAALNILGEIFGFRNPETGKIFLLKQAEFWRSVDVIPEHTGIMIKRYKRDLTYYTDQVSGQAVTHPEMRRGLKRGKIK